MAKIKFINFFDGKVAVDGIEYNFGEESIGYRRHYAASVAGVQISRIIHVPYTREIRINSIARIDGFDYIIESVQPTRATNPPCTVLTLIEYGVNINDG